MARSRPRSGTWANIVRDEGAGSGDGLRYFRCTAEGTVAAAWMLAAGLLAPHVALGQVPPAGAAVQPANLPNPPAPPPEIRVEGSRPERPARIDPVERFDAQFVDRTDAFTADEVLTELTASLPGTQQLILVDGHETTLDITTIPAGRIDHIEVSTTGVMPDGRPRFPGNVINIVLKQKYNGANLGARRRDSLAGGGGQSQVNAFGGYTLDRLSGTLNLVYREQDALLAGERDFSRTEDYTTLGGADYRAPYGTLPVVQAVTGSLNGITDVNGDPAAIALATRTHPLTPADFIAAPPGTTSAEGLRHFNASDFLYLVAPSKSQVANGDLTYALTQTTKLHAGYTFTHSESRQQGPPPITPVGSGSVVPAAFNPFGQDVEAGLVHSSFGGVQRQTTSQRSSGFVSADGRFATTWTWSGRFDAGHRVATSGTRDLDPQLLAAALATSDPAHRFDPFADTGPGSADAALYPALTAIRRSGATSDDTRARADAQGQVSEGWIEPIVLRFGVDRSTHDSRQNIDPGASIGPQVETRIRVTSLHLNGDLDVPLFRVRQLESPAVLTLSTYATRDRQASSPSDSPPQSQEIDTFVLGSLLNVPWTLPADGRRYAHQLETRAGVGLAHSTGNADVTEEAGALWSPAEPFTFRADYSRQQASNPATLYPLTVEYDQTLIDRRRGDAVAGNVEVVSSQPEAQSPPLVTRLVLSAQWNPPGAAKLRIRLRYADIEQKGQQRVFSAQDILDNEVALAGRVVRLAPTADDLAAGLPGEIAEVDITPFNGGQRRDRTLALLAQASATLPRLGTLSFRGSAQHTLSSTNELIDGIQVVSTNEQEVPPAWSAAAQVELEHGSWGAYGSFNYSGTGTYAGLPYASFGTVDARVAYELDKPLGGWLGRTLRISAGIQNLLNRNPPFANTITGFHGGSPLGRTYELTVRAVVGD